MGTDTEVRADSHFSDSSNEHKRFVSIKTDHATVTKEFGTSYYSVFM